MEDVMRKILVNGLAVLAVVLIGGHYLRGEPVAKATSAVTIQMQAVEIDSKTVLEGKIGSTKFQTTQITFRVGEPNEMRFSLDGEQVQLKQGKRTVIGNFIEVTMQDGRITRFKAQ